MNTPASPTPAAPARPSVIQLAIKEKGALYAAYIPLFAEGGIFIPTSREYRLGDDVYVLLTLPDDPQRYPVAGKVAWITPARAAGNRAPGVGIRFPVGREVAPAEGAHRRSARRHPGLRPPDPDHLSSVCTTPTAAAAVAPPFPEVSRCSPTPTAT